MNGVSPNDENKSGFTPIHLAAKCGHADVFDLFAKTGISLKQPSSKIGMTALHIGRNIDIIFYSRLFTRVLCSCLLRRRGHLQGTVQAHPCGDQVFTAHQTRECPCWGIVLRGWPGKLYQTYCSHYQLTPQTALHLASYSGSENVVRAILNQPGVDVKQPSSPSGIQSSIT